MLFCCAVLSQLNLSNNGFTAADIVDRGFLGVALGLDPGELRLRGFLDIKRIIDRIAGFVLRQRQNVDLLLEHILEIGLLRGGILSVQLGDISVNRVFRLRILKFAAKHPDPAHCEEKEDDKQDNIDRHADAPFGYLAGTGSCRAVIGAA